MAHEEDQLKQIKNKVPEQSSLSATSNFVSLSLATFNMHIEETNNPPNTLDHGKTTVNEYATKKTFALGNLEIALITTNAVQLKTLLGHKTDRDTYWWIGLILVCASILIQVINACVLGILGTNNIDKERRQHRLVVLNNISMVLSVFINVINIVLNVIVGIEPQILAQTPNATKIL